MSSLFLYAMILRL